MLVRWWWLFSYRAHCVVDRGYKNQVTICLPDVASGSFFLVSRAVVAGLAVLFVQSWKLRKLVEILC